MDPWILTDVRLANFQGEDGEKLGNSNLGKDFFFGGKLETGHVHFFCGSWRIKTNGSESYSHTTKNRLAFL